MKGLREHHIRILNILAEHPEGLPLSFIHLNTTTEPRPEKANTSQFLLKLLNQHYVQRHDRLYFITREGIEAIKRFKDGIEGVASGSQKDLTIPSPAQPPPVPAKAQSAPAQAPTPPKEPQDAPTHAHLSKPSLAYPHQRMHAIKLTARLYRTSYDRWEQIADAMGMEYREVRNVRPKQYLIEWQGIKLKLTRHKLIAYVKEIAAPIEVSARDLESKALRDNLQRVEAFLDRTNLRCQRGLDGSLIAKIKGWEIAFTSNEVARRLTQKGGYIAIAFNRETGKATLWADRSFTAELEAGEEAMHEKMRQWGQGIQDGIIKPYEDEMATRRQLQQIADTMLGLAKSQERLTSSQLVQSEHLNFYAEQIAAHSKAIMKLNVVLDKLDRVLSQRKLGEYQG